MTPPNPRRLGLTAVCLMGVLVVLTVYSVHPSLPFNPIELPLESRVRPVCWLPQGWGFFTRNPREDCLYYYVVDENGAWTPASSGSLGSPHNLFGLNRRPRVQGVEAAHLLSAIRKDDWIEIEVGTVAYLNENTSSPSRSIKNPMPHPTLRGQIAIVTQPTVPWAWRRSRRTLVMPSRIVVVEVE